MNYAEQHGIPVEMKKKSGSPYSMDANLLHISYEGRILEDPAQEPEESMWRWSVSPEKAPDEPEYLDLEFKQGDIVALNGEEALARSRTRQAQSVGRQAWHWAPGSGGKPLCRNEIPGMLRDARRYDHAARPSGNRIHYARPRGGSSEGRTDAALCRADLQWLLVEPRAQDDAGHD